MFEDLRVKHNFYRFFYTDDAPFKVYKVCQWKDGKLLECCIINEQGIRIKDNLSKSRILHYMYDSHFTTKILEVLQ